MIRPNKIWTAERDAILRRTYPLGGSEASSVATGLSPSQCLHRANTLHISLNPDAYRRKVHAAASSYMRDHNPAKRLDVQRKLAKWRSEHPEKCAENLAKFMEGHRRIQKDKPTKLERTLFRHLDLLGVDYEPYAMVKPRFIVDARCDCLIIQADGDYWHGHPRFKPLTERQLAQRRRDHAQDRYLRAAGYRVIRIWESEMSLANVAEVLGFDPPRGGEDAVASRT